MACGSEDSCVYIWNKEKGEILTKLEGHTQIVNMVHWNPMDPYIFASASDDMTVRIWGLEDMDMSELIIEKDLKKFDAQASVAQNAHNSIASRQNGSLEVTESDDDQMQSDDDSDDDDDRAGEWEEDEELS